MRRKARTAPDQRCGHGTGYDRTRHSPFDQRLSSLLLLTLSSLFHTASAFSRVVAHSEDWRKWKLEAIEEGGQRRLKRKRNVKRA